VKRLLDLGFKIVSTSGTADVLRRNAIEAEVVLKHAERGDTGRSIVDWINAGEVDMVVNSPSGPSASARADGYAIRAAAAATDTPIITTVQQLAAAVQAIESQLTGGLDVTSLQDHAAALDLFGVGVEA
jgi:carbamoyl-phosphate synthase large subunit